MITGYATDFPRRRYAKCELRSPPGRGGIPEIYAVMHKVKRISRGKKAAEFGKTWKKRKS